jgi:DNA-binding TFAR19-related protein (PDSD5 family)
MCPKRQSSHAAAKSQVNSSTGTFADRPVPKESSVLSTVCADSKTPPKERELVKLTVNYANRAAQTEAQREVKSVKEHYYAFQNAFLSWRASERVYLQEFNMVTPRPGQGLEGYLRYLSVFSKCSKKISERDIVYRFLSAIEIYFGEIYKELNKEFNQNRRGVMKHQVTLMELAALINSAKVKEMVKTMYPILLVS